jgi:hypothetical protein
MIHCVLYAEKRATMPRPPKTKVLEEALEKLHAAREALAQAFASLLSQLDLRPIAQALTDWRQAVEALQEEAQTVYDDASAYFRIHGRSRIRGRPTIVGYCAGGAG